MVFIIMQVIYNLQTFDITKNAVISTLSLLTFDTNNAKEYVLRFDIQEQLNNNRTFSESTLAYWNTMPNELKDSVFSDDDRLSHIDIYNKLK